MARFTESRQPEPLPIAQEIRDLLDRDEVVYDPFVYLIKKKQFDFQTVNKALYELPPPEVEVTIRFRVKLPRR
jgi:hypothetical protein